MTFALYFGNRGFMPGELITGAREDMIRAVTDAGYDPFEKKLMGVTAMTKLLGTKKFNTLLGSLIEKPQGKPTLVPESDRRPTWTINDFQEED